MSIYNSYTTFNLATNQEKFEQQYTLFGDTQKKYVEKLIDTVSRTEIVSNSLPLYYGDGTLEQYYKIIDETRTLQNSFYFYIDSKNGYAGKLDEKLTEVLSSTRTEAKGRVEILKMEDKTPSLPITGGEDSELEKIFNNYLIAEKKLMENQKKVK